MEKIHIGFMKDLKNIEFEELFDNISHTLAIQNIDNQTLVAARKRISPHNKELLRMKYKKLSHPLTQVMQEQMQNRTKYLACLRLKVDASILSPDSEECDAALHLQLWLSHYKKGLYPPTFDMQSRMVSNLMEDRILSIEIQKATKLLHLDKLLKIIVELTSKIRANILIRLNDRDKYIVKGQDIRKAAYADLRLFVEAMEVTYKLSIDEAEKEHLQDISCYLNDELKGFRTKLRVRTTKRKNNKKMVVAVKKLIGAKMQQNNLPMIVYEGLIIDPSVRLLATKKLENATSSSSVRRVLKISSSENGLKNRDNDLNRIKSATKKHSEDSFITNIDKGKEEMGGNVPILPINKT